MTMFDGYIMVDWSAANSRTTGKDSIWVAELMENVNDVILTNYPTRSCFRKYLKGKMEEATENNKRLLIGFDFPFGYPYDSYDGFGCKNWTELCQLIDTEIDDNDNNENNRFAAAGKLNNTRFGKLFENNNKHGPFWGHHRSNCFEGLPFNTQEGYNRNLKAGQKLPEKFRCVEKEIIKQNRKNKKIKKQRTITPLSVWKLFHGASVGGQTLMGIPTLQTLKQRGDCCVWPFQNLDKTKHVIAEIYPSIWDIQGDHNINDANQVYTVAKNIAYLDKNKRLQDFLNAPDAYDKNIIKKEGWILGVDKNGIPAQCP